MTEMLAIDYIERPETLKITKRENIKNAVNKYKVSFLLYVFLRK